MTMGGRRLPHTGDGSRLGEESREEGLEDSERGDKGLMRGPPLPSSVEGKRDAACGSLSFYGGHTATILELRGDHPTHPHSKRHITCRDDERQGRH